MPVLWRRGVHLDLKGLPPTPARLLKLLDLFAAARFRCVLVEWEDSFPWTCDPRFRSETAYTPDEIDVFHRRARELGLQIVPLVQSLGHMETPLRIDHYAPLRELPDRIDGLNSLAPGARELVQRMVDDVVARTGPITHFHLGGDEAFTFGQNPQTRQYVAEHGRASLYLHHVRPILQSLNARRICPILWHDMMRDWDDASVAELAGMADVMVWSYQDSPDEAVIERFERAGVVVWGASAYKGADSRGDAEIPDVPRRTANALVWAEVAARHRLAGVIATGWSRYQTTRVQCEPIDGALDSLVRTGAALHDGRDIGQAAAESLLASIGELDTFRACHGSLARFSESHRSASECLRLLDQQLNLERRDPRRRSGGGVAPEMLRVAREHLAATHVAADAVLRALEGLVPAVWIESFLAERIEPLMQRLAQQRE
jgi:hexosaminidase